MDDDTAKKVYVVSQEALAEVKEAIRQFNDLMEGRYNDLAYMDEIVAENEVLSRENSELRTMLAKRAAHATRWFGAVCSDDADKLHYSARYCPICGRPLSRTMTPEDGDAADGLAEYVDELQGAIHNLRAATDPEGVPELLEAARENAMDILMADPRRTVDDATN